MDQLATTSDEIFTDSNCSYDNCTLFTFIVYILIQTPMFALGITGNIVSFIVLQLDRHNKEHARAASLLLQVMAVIDCCFLVTTELALAIPAGTLYYKQPQWLTVYVLAYWCPLVHAAQLATVYITVLIAFNRYMAICEPFRETYYSTRAVKRQVVYMVIAVSLYSIPRFFEYTTDCLTSSTESNTWNRTNSAINGENNDELCSRELDCRWLESNRAYKVIYQNILYFVVVYLAPFVVIIKLNVHIIRELHSSPALIRQNNHQDADDRKNITIVMLVIIGVFLLTQTPGLINQVLDNFLVGKCPHAYFYYHHISNLFVSSNSCVNFVIYCACRKRFRQRLKYTFSCGRLMRAEELLNAPLE